jgi:hypothetical protein
MANALKTLNTVIEQKAIDEMVDIHQALILLMSDKKERGQTDIVAHFLDEGLVSPDDVDKLLILLKALCNDGTLSLINRGKSADNSFYRLKNIVSRSYEQQPLGSVRKYAPPVVAEKDTTGIIAVSEGLDVCIWKVMQDREKRRLWEVAEILAAYGLEKEVIKNRFIVLMKRGWFTKTERPGQQDVVYCMKKGIRMPGKQRPKLGIPAKPLVAVPKEVPKVTVVKVASVSKVIPETMTVKVPEMSKVKTISASEGLRTCVWKVMSDFDFYSKEDVALLLDAESINVSTTISLMSELYAKGWFDAKYIDGTRCYKLRPTIEMPTNEKPYLRQKPRASSKAAAIAESTIAGIPTPPPVAEPMVRQSDTVSEEMQSLIGSLSASRSSFHNAQHNPKPTPQREPVDTSLISIRAPKPIEIKPITDLVEVVVVIVGINFTFNEALAVYEALVKDGFDRPGFIESRSDYMITLKGKVITAREAHAVALQLKSALRLQ